MAYQLGSLGFFGEAFGRTLFVYIHEPRRGRRSMPRDLQPPSLNVLAKNACFHKLGALL